MPAVQEWTIIPAAPLDQRSITAIPSSPSCPLIALGSSVGVDAFGFAGKVPHKVDLVNASVDKDASPVVGLPAAPAAGLEGIFLLELKEAQVAHRAVKRQFPALPDLRHIANIFGHHQGNPGIRDCPDYGLGIFERMGQGFFNQDVLAVRDAQFAVPPVQVVGSADVQGIDPAVFRSLPVAAEAVLSAKAAAVFFRPGRVPAGEKQVNFIVELGQAAGEVGGILAAAYYAQGESGGVH